MGSLDKNDSEAKGDLGEKFNLHNLFGFVADKYNLVQFFGESTSHVYSEPKRMLVNDVMYDVLRQLAGGMYLDGSAIRTPLFGKEFYDVTRNEYWLQQAEPNMLNAVMRGLWGAEKDTSAMSDQGYLGAMIVGRMIGPSIDVRSERMDWTHSEVQTLVDLWKTQLEPGVFLTKIQQGSRVMLYVNHRDGRRGGMYFHAQLQGEENGGKLPSHVWSQQNTWRRRQQGKLVVSKVGMLTIHTETLPQLNTPIELLIDSTTRGQNWQLLARAMRTLVMNGASPDLLDKKSFALRANLPDAFTMQQYVDTMSHLMVAFFQDPGAICKMLVSVGFPEDKMTDWPRSKEEILPYLRDNYDTYPDTWGLMLNDCDEMMRGPEVVAKAAHLPGIGQLKMVAPLFELLSPLTYQDAMRVVNNTPRLSIKPCGDEVDWDAVRRAIYTIGVDATSRGNVMVGEKLANASKALVLEEGDTYLEKERDRVLI